MIKLSVVFSASGRVKEGKFISVRLRLEYAYNLY